MKSNTSQPNQYFRSIAVGSLCCSLLAALSNSASAYTTDNWSGVWQCDPEATLTIQGNGESSQISAYYPYAHNGDPAQEIYRITFFSGDTARGTYIYNDTNPAYGPTGERGVWTGTWEITLYSNGLNLYRNDDAGDWEGNYTCRQ